MFFAPIHARIDGAGQGLAGRLPLALSARKWVVWLLLICLAASLSACKIPDRNDLRELRKKLSNQSYADGKDITMAVVWSLEKGDFLSGAILAAEEVNAEGGVDGRRLKLEFIDEDAFLKTESVKRSLAEGRYRNALQVAGTRMAKLVVENEDVTAVIGHSNISATLSAMLTYQDNNILFLGGGTSDSRVMWSSESLYFQLLPQDVILAKAMAEKIQAMKWNNVYFVYEGLRHNEQVVELLKTEFASAGIAFSGAVAIMPDIQNPHGSRRLQRSLTTLREGDVDAIVLIAGPRLGAQIIRQSRTLGILQPFMGVGSLDSPHFTKKVGDAGLDTRIASLRSDGYQIEQFRQRFKQRFPDAPSADVAAQVGYDSVRLYAEAVASAGSSDAFLVSHALHYKLSTWYGLLGSYSFRDGAVSGLKYHIRRLEADKDGQFRFVPDDVPG